MMQRLGVDEDADVELRGAEIEAGAVLEPQRVDVARLVARDAGGIGPVRRGQRLCVGQRAGQVLIDAVVACVKARRDTVGEPQPHLAVEAPDAPPRMAARSEGRRLGTEWGSTCGSRGYEYH